MNGKIRWIALILCALAGLLASCSPKPPATREDRLKWNFASLTNSYQSAGRKDPKWDTDAVQSFREFARLRVASDDEELVLSDLAGNAAENAVSAGCDDPMVRYFYVKYSSPVKAKPLADRKELYRAAASNLENSAYPPLRKFYANVDAAQILYVPRDTNVWPLVRQFRGLAVDNLAQALQDKTLPESEAYEAADALFELLSHNNHELTNAYNKLAATLSDKSIKPAVGALVKAEFYLQFAWRARGNGTADQVTEEGWRLFKERLAEAESALDQAWSLDPYDAQIPTVMISIATGQQKPRPEMEKWFQRAMMLDRENYPACRAKLHYLLPQWYGSREDLLKFGRECVAATNWTGRVPLILVDAHSELARLLKRDDRRDYWLHPDVWPDIKAGYERFAQINPDATRFRYPYAYYAVRCGQWQDFSEQINLIRQNDGKVNETYFGGKEQFEELVNFAKTNSVAPPN